MNRPNRINKPITVTLTPESIEALEILAEEMGEEKVSRIVDAVIKEAMKNRGYSPNQEER